MVSRKFRDKVRDARRRDKRLHREPFHGRSDSSGNARFGVADRVADSNVSQLGDPDTEDLRRSLLAALEGNVNVRRTLELLWEHHTKEEIASTLDRSSRSVDLYCAEIEKTLRKIARTQDE